jgi:hypothetical protein
VAQANLEKVRALRGGHTAMALGMPWHPCGSSSNGLMPWPSIVVIIARMARRGCDEVSASARPPDARPGSLAEVVSDLEKER